MQKAYAMSLRPTSVQFFAWSGKSMQLKILNCLCKLSRSFIELRMVFHRESLHNEIF